ncbi:MAG: hypothetical protein BWZ01_02837 [Deltaproteobacteria bacterium ADurb.BinA179]|nr:MAG: hypothetical protein BWZ01_02837 [Deltaproteobacteria bacterium ADurb.BinA179]
MRHTITTTTAVRSCSAPLNEIKNTGTVSPVEYSGKPMVELYPVSSPSKTRMLSGLPLIVKGLPKLGVDVNAFARNVEDNRRSL